MGDPLLYNAKRRPVVGDTVRARTGPLAVQDMVVAEIVRDDPERSLLRCTWPGDEKVWNETDLEFVSR